jgi:predicted house-cleaning NTP pyrophosphatase (Maf/HAM1 superfamily)
MKPVKSSDDIASEFTRLNDSDAGIYLGKLAGFSPLAANTNEPATVVLGSHSPRRELILGRLLGIQHKCFVINADEHLPAGRYDPDVVSKCLTAQKLISYAKKRQKIREAGNILIVSDTIVVGKNGEIMGKETSSLKTDDEKYEFCLKRISSFMDGKIAVYSSIAIADFRTQKVLIGCDTVLIHFCHAGSREKEIIKHYCRHIYDREMIKSHRGPIGKAGSFGIQEPEILCVVEKIEGDVTVAVGLPANLTLRLLNNLPGLLLPSKYNAEDCVDIIFSNAISDNSICGKNLRSHALSLIR